MGGGDLTFVYFATTATNDIQTFLGHVLSCVRLELAEGGKGSKVERKVKTRSYGELIDNP